MNRSVPEFAVVGHPNEGKSSVLSTLAEDDSVRISPMPGETRECQTFPVTIDGREIIRFTDTPGFQNPRKILKWMQEYSGPDEELIRNFIVAHTDDPAFHDDCHLLQPLLRGAGIIFVVDGSRPLRNTDKAEMEILRLTGCPRMAIINCKDEETAWLAKWQAEFRKHFNSIRIFNSCRATYSERIALFESLKGIDQDLQSVLDQVVAAFRADWAQRNQQVVEMLLDLLEQGIGYTKSVLMKTGADEEQIRSKLHSRYVESIEQQEKKCRERMRSLYKHNIFNCDLPPHSILKEDLFSEKSWEFLGLNQSQLVMAGGLSGAAIGAGLDVAAAGLTFGIFSAVGGVIGAAGAAIKGREFLSGVKLLGMRLDEQRLTVGPVKNIQLLYILLDRQLLFYSHIINWAHGRRDYERQAENAENLPAKLGCTSEWSREKRRVCEHYFASLQDSELSASGERDAMGRLIGDELLEMSTGSAA